MQFVKLKPEKNKNAYVGIKFHSQNEICYQNITLTIKFPDIDLVIQNNRIHIKLNCKNKCGNR